MLDIKHLLPKLPPSSRGPTSEWAEQIKAVLDFMGEDNQRFPYWCGRLRRYKSKPAAIFDLLKEARNGSNPQALFQWLLKNKV